MTRYWGPCTWYLFHTLAEKVKDDHFVSVKDSLIAIIKQICSNLPCPECAGHAQHKLASLNVKNIRNKRDLKMMLLSFHNDVNKRVGNPMLTEQQLDEKYKTANTGNIIQYFLQTWRKPNSNPKLLTVSLHKSRALQEFTSWWSKNYIHFTP